MYDVTYNSRPILRSTEERNDGQVPIDSEAVHPSPKLNKELQYFHCCIKYLKLGTNRYLYTHVHSSTVQHSPKVETTKSPLMDESSKQRGPSIQQNTIQPRKRKCRHMLQHEPWRHYAKWHEPGTKGPILYDPPLQEVPRAIIQRQKTEHWLLGAGGEEGGVQCRRRSPTWEDKRSAAEDGGGCSTVRMDSTRSTMHLKRQKGKTMNIWRKAMGREKDLSQILPTC